MMNPSYQGQCGNHPSAPGNTAELWCAHEARHLLVETGNAESFVVLLRVPVDQDANLGEPNRGWWWASRPVDLVGTKDRNYEGFYGVWPGITRDENTDPRTRDLGRWLDATEKVVVSRTLDEAPWNNSRITRDLAAEVTALRQQRGRDVLVTNSASVIAELLRLDLIDDLRMFVVPVLVGGGLRLFPDGVDVRFTTAGVPTLANGVVGLHLTRP